jgi:regulatory protein
VRWRSRVELGRRLRAAGFPPEEIEDALEGLERAGLIDDERFARELVRDQSERRRASTRAIRGALWEKGITGEVADGALADVGDEGERAAALARARAVRLSGLPPDAAYRRLFGLLTRRGYPPSVAREATRAALADLLPDPDGAD